MAGRPLKVLTDVHTLVWSLEDPDQLSGEARKVMGDGEVLASAANLWELLLKRNKKGALMKEPLSWWQRWVVATGIPTLGIRVTHVIALGELPDIHKDPFDRILVAQSIVEKIPIVSKDSQLAKYGVPIIW